MSDEIDWSKRMSAAWRIAEEGGTLGDVALAWGCSKSNACMRVSERDSALQRVLRDNARSGPSLKPEHALQRLQRVQAHGVRAAAEAEGLGETAIRNWLTRNAPDGVAMALEDYAA